MSARRISFVNFKGGVGKTTLSVNVAACLAHDFNQRVLLVDCDSQSNASIWLMGINRWDYINSKPGKSIYGAFTTSLPIAGNIRHSVLEGENGKPLIPTLDLLPATYELMELEQEYQEVNGEPFYFKFYEHLRILFDQYDYIIFDCPPNVFRASKCAIFTSREIYVPCHLDTLSYIGLSLLTRKIEAFHQQTVIQQGMIPDYQPALIRGVVLNDVLGTANFDLVRRQMHTRMVEARRRNVVSKDADILKQEISSAVQAARAVGENLPVTLARKDSTLKDNYINLARYIHATPLAT